MPVESQPGQNATAAAIQAYNTSHLSSAPGDFMPSPAAKPVTSISTDQGVTALTKATNTATRLMGSSGPAQQTGIPPAGWDQTTYNNFKAANPGLEPNAEDTKRMQGTDAGAKQTATFINPTTEQSATIDPSDTAGVQALMKQGYQFAEGAYPGSLYQTTEPEVAQSKQALAAAASDLSAAKAKLTSFNVSGDPMLQSLLGGISSGWDARMADLQKAEESRIAAMGSMGIRLGSQWTGGAGGIMGGIISGEERAMVDKLTQLQAQKDGALSQAQNAYASQKWSQYSSLVNQAQSTYDKQLKATQDLQKLQVDQNQKLSDQMTAQTRSLQVAKLMADGAGTPSDILTALQKTDSTVTSKDVSNIMKDLTPTTAKGASFKFSQGQLSQLYAGGFSPQDIQKLSDYYNGSGDPRLLDALTPEAQSIVHNVLNGTAAKRASSSIPTYAQSHPATKSGNLVFTESDIKKGRQLLLDSADPAKNPRGDGHYSDPDLYLQMAQQWVQHGGHIKDFIKNYPVTLTNPANTYVTPQINQMVRQESAAVSTSKTAGGGTNDIAAQINAAFPSGK